MSQRLKAESVSGFGRGRAMEAIASKSANALIKNAEINKRMKATLSLFNQSLIAFSLLERFFKPALNGFWVGGTVLLFQDRLIFAPNLANRMVHEKLDTIEIPLHRISDVRVRYGIATKIVETATGEELALTFRCYGAKRFANLIRKSAGLMPI
jgi:hypothetical protein